MSRRGPLTPLLTPWGESLDPDHPLPEYPRPQLVRDSYLCLNGRWDYAITQDEREPAAYDGQIVVPFSPECLLSGVQRPVGPSDVLHYRRTVRLPTGFRAHADDRLLLHFGAVDRWCRVVVDDVVVGEHEGGYLPFCIDVTEALAGADTEPHVLRVVVRDPTDAQPGARGKQRLRRGGIWYTPQSGIWQTVWLESAPPVRVDRVVVTPDVDVGALSVVVQAAGSGGTAGHGVECRVVVDADGREVARGSAPAGTSLRLTLPEPRTWSPEDPFLYDLEIVMGRDRVRSYAALRSFGIGRDAQGRMRFLLNGSPYLHVGVLDQGYWSDGMYTAPSDEALVHDIATMKRLGFTMLRKHAKVEPLRWYHHCDRLGMLVWQDVVNGGGRYDPVVVSVPAVTPFRLRDNHYRAFGRTSASDRAQWRAELRATVELLRDSPCVAVWVPFNEGWGQFDAAGVAAEVRTLDPTRPVDHASGWHDQGAGDVDSRHVYFRRFRLPRIRSRAPGRVPALTEYGGYSWRVPGHSVSAREFGYRRFPTQAALAEAFASLHEEQIVPAVGQGLGATVYTQLSDVEDETNGLLTYDRRLLKVPEAVVRRVTGLLRLPP